MLISVGVVAAMLSHAMEHCATASANMLGARPFAPRAARALDALDSRAGAEPCDSAAFCVGPSRCYPTNESISWYAEFDIPPLPTTFESTTMTDYIYFNVFFGYGQDHDNPHYPACECVDGSGVGPDCCSGDGHGRFNQFVPQLMLGSALCNSSNASPDPETNKTYTPYWCDFKSWHIGAQYYFATYQQPCANHSSKCAFDSHAATGDLIAVTPGERVYTRFERKRSSGTGGATMWKLTMGVVGDRITPSVVEAHAPYMGLVPSAPSWDADVYSLAYAGSCWELYGMQRATDYPPFMHYSHTLRAPTHEPFWQPWGMDEGNATTACRTVRIDSDVSADGTTQTVAVNATMHLGGL